MTIKRLQASSSAPFGPTSDRRTLLKAAGAAAAVGATGIYAPAVLGQAKPFAGVTITGASWQNAFNEHLKAYLPEFEEQTGMKVDFQQQAFPVFNQRTDLELSTQGSAYDFCTISFLNSGRWIGAGWFHPLNELLADANRTTAEFDPKDFLAGAQVPFTGADGSTYGFAWEGGAMLMAISRSDLLDKAGLATPTTFDELLTVCERLHGQEGVAAFVNDRLHHFQWPPYLMGFGGAVFKDPPNDLTPTLDTPEAARAADYYARLLEEFSPPGVLSYTEEQATRAHYTGRANIRTQAILWLSQLSTNPDTQVAGTVRYAHVPAGPAGAFPAANSQAFGIPVGARNKEAAWAFIQWALSKETLRRMVEEKGYSAVCRRSIIDSDLYNQRMTLNGQNVGALYREVLEKGGREGYMKYRFVPVFPQVADKLNKAIERVASGQASGEDAMRQAQAETVTDLRKAGVPL